MTGAARWTSCVLALGLGCCTQGGAPAANREPALQIEAGPTVASLQLGQLRDRLASHRVEVEDIVYRRQKVYEGFWLPDVLALAGLELAPDDRLLVNCEDGYCSYVAASWLEGEPRPLLAVRDVEAGVDWSPLPPSRGEGNPGPFYLVWSQTAGVNPRMRPWPFQIRSVEVVKRDDLSAATYPKGAGPDSAEQRGFELFQQFCVSCHAINHHGGTVGPELNVPRNVTEYFKDDALPGFILDASDYQANSRMPPFTGLLDAGDVTDVVAYLRWMKDHKVGRKK